MSKGPRSTGPVLVAKESFAFEHQVDLGGLLVIVGGGLVLHLKVVGGRGGVVELDESPVGSSLTTLFAIRRSTSSVHSARSLDAKRIHGYVSGSEVACRPG